MECPRCQNELKAEHIKDLKDQIPLHHCDNCEGIWISAPSLETLEKVTDIQLLEIKQVPSAKEQKVPLKCPIHNDTIMDKFKHPKDSAVIYDQCPKCQGVWLDKGELKAIQEEGIGKLTGDVILWFFGLK